MLEYHDIAMLLEYHDIAMLLEYHDIAMLNIHVYHGFAMIKGYMFSVTESR